MTASKRTAMVVTEEFGRSRVWLCALSLCAVSACTSDGDGGAALGGSAGASGGSAGNSAPGGSAGTASGGSAGSSTAGSGSGTATCPASALFCDDFEEDAVGQPPAAPW